MEHWDVGILKNWNIGEKTLLLHSIQPSIFCLNNLPSFHFSIIPMN